MKVTYVHTGKNLQFKKIELYQAPYGWIRLDLLKDRLKENIEYRNKFTKEELKRINKKK